MSKIVALTRRELGVYFVSPMAYIILTATLFITGYAFVGNTIQQVLRHAPADFEGTFNVISSVMTFITPLVTMRLIAEEKNRGTLETVMTAPVSELQFILSKFCAAMCFFLFLLAPTIVYVFVVYKVSEGGAVDFGAVTMGYVGLILFLAALVSIGMFISSLTSSEVTAGVVTLIVMVLMFMMGNLIAELKDWPRIQKVVAYLWAGGHMENFSRGLLDTRDLVYFASIVTFFLGGTAVVVGSRRWR